MLSNYAPWSGLEAYHYDKCFLGENGKKMLGGRQRIISSMHRWRKVICYIMMPLVVAYKFIKGELPGPILFLEGGGGIIFLGGHQCIISSIHGCRKGSILPNWCGQEAYRRGVTMTNYFG